MRSLAGGTGGRRTPEAVRTHGARTLHWAAGEMQYRTEDRTGDNNPHIFIPVVCHSASSVAHEAANAEL